MLGTPPTQGIAYIPTFQKGRGKVAIQLRYYMILEISNIHHVQIFSISVHSEIITCCIFLIIPYR